ncbi:MAG: HDOD domain-containing protein [Rhodoferax sp.]|nr:HDOD domain-containing protein [Rhodoferax sp.]
MTDITTFVQSVKLPVMPEAAYALVRTLHDDDAHVADVQAIIAKDPALTATLLRMANSALFGIPRSVDTLDHAVQVVGMSQIRARALGICISQVFQLPDTIDRLAFWRFSMVCAGYARVLAQHAGIDEQQAWLTAMMVRLGELVIALHSPDLIAGIEQLPRAPGERWKRERDRVGFDECQVTGEVARRWDFPSAVVQALAHCGDAHAALQTSRLCAVVHVAALWADHCAAPEASPSDLPAVAGDVLARLGLDTHALADRLPPPDTFTDLSALAA